MYIKKSKTLIIIKLKHFNIQIKNIFNYEKVVKARNIANNIEGHQILLFFMNLL